MLNQAQKEAIETTEGRLLVLAGAGSGKTRVIVHRISHLISAKQVKPDLILGLTFTNKAAAEMRHRTEALIGAQQASLVTLSTFHSFCMQILRKEIALLGYTKDFSLYDEADLDRMIKQLAKEMLGHDKDLPSLSSTKAAIASASCLQDMEDSSTWHDQFSKELYERLQSTLRAYNAVSFDHLIHLTILLFETSPTTLEYYQDRYPYILIDEYQDTNPAQYRLAELLALKHKNLCVVGDDDQSIYGWRGAKVEHILHFQADRTIKLEQNFRSTSVILEAANAVISHNKARHQKQLWSSKKTDDLISVMAAPSEIEEAKGVVDRLLHFHIHHGYAWKDMAVLYRSNALSRQLEIALLQASWEKENSWVRGIPYEVFGGLEFSERSEIKDLFAYLRVITNPLDEEALLRIINVPRRGISDLFLDELTKENRRLHIPLWDLLVSIQKEEKTFPSHPKGMAGTKLFVQLILKAQADLQTGSLSTFLTRFLEDIQYKKAIQEDVKSDKMRVFKWENIEECIQALASYEKETKDASLQNFIAHTTLGKPSFGKESKPHSEDKVQLMTLHSAKGLEFPVCFIIGLEDHILPHEKSMKDTGIEEERRLFYVGLTRAKEHLCLTMARSRMRMGKTQTTSPSRFLFEIPSHLFKPISHKTAL